MGNFFSSMRIVHVANKTEDTTPPNKHSVMDQLTLALDGEILMGNPILAHYKNHDIIGFYTGENSNSLKLGFAKNLNPNMREGYVNYDNSFAKTENYEHLITSGVLTNNKTFNKKIKEIPIHTPVILVQWPNKYHIGFWNGIDNHHKPRLDICYHKEKNEYADIFHLAELLFDDEISNSIKYETPSLEKILQIRILATNIINPEVYR